MLEMQLSRAVGRQLPRTYILVKQRDCRGALSLPLHKEIGTVCQKTTFEALKAPNHVAREVLERAIRRSVCRISIEHCNIVNEDP